MKTKLFKSLIPLLLITGAGSVFADNPLNMSLITTVAPSAAAYCNALPDHWRGEGCPVANIASGSTAATSTILLLKDIQAAQPDALNYIAGGAPSPTLYSTVEQLQKFTSEALGEEIAFEEAIEMIIEAN